jgi:hypothetical protein
MEYAMSLLEPTRILLTFVGHIREFRNALPSQVRFVKDILEQHRIESEDREIPKLDIYLSFITWDESYSIFPKKIKSFVEKGINNQTLRIIIGNSFDGIAAGIKVNTVERRVADTKFPEMKVPRSVEEFSYVAFLHEKSLDSMLQFEYEENFKFSAIFLTRPDMLLQLKQLNLSWMLSDMSDNTVYSRASGTYFELPAFWSTTGQQDKIQFEQFVDQFNVFGRTAFYAYGLMFRFMCASRNINLFTPSLHFWVLHYLEKFRITISPLYFMNLDALILRPTHIIQPLAINFSEVIVNDGIEQLRQLENQWQAEVDNGGKVIDWIKLFIDKKIEFSL